MAKVVKLLKKEEEKKLIDFTKNLIIDTNVKIYEQVMALEIKGDKDEVSNKRYFLHRSIILDLFENLMKKTRLPQEFLDYFINTFNENVMYVKKEDEVKSNYIG